MSKCVSELSSFFTSHYALDVAKYGETAGKIAKSAIMSVALLIPAMGNVITDVLTFSCYVFREWPLQTCGPLTRKQDKLIGDETGKTAKYM